MSEKCVSEHPRPILTLLSLLQGHYSSGAGTILEQGGQDQKRQSLQRDIRFFAKIGSLFAPKTSVL